MNIFLCVLGEKQDYLYTFVYFRVFLIFFLCVNVSGYAHTHSNGSLCNLQGLAESSRSSEEFGDTIYSRIAPVNMPDTNFAHNARQHHSTPTQNNLIHNHTVTTQNNSFSVTKKKRKSFSTLSKMFGKSRSRRSIAVSDPSILEGKSLKICLWFLCVRGVLS